MVVERRRPINHPAWIQIRRGISDRPRFCAACTVPEVISFARTIETWQAPIIAAIQTRADQRPHRGLQPHGQARRAHRVRLPRPRQPTPPRTVGLHPPITAGHTQSAPMPMLTAKSRKTVVLRPDREMCAVWNSTTCSAGAGLSHRTAPRHAVTTHPVPMTAVQVSSTMATPEPRPRLPSQLRHIR